MLLTHCLLDLDSRGTTSITITIPIFYILAIFHFLSNSLFSVYHPTRSIVFEIGARYPLSFGVSFV